MIRAILKAGLVAGLVTAAVLPAADTSGRRVRATGVVRAVHSVMVQAPRIEGISGILTLATIIIEAGETSGTLVQARHALKQGKKLFILESNFKNPALTWPAKFEEQGAIRVRDYEDIRKHLADPPLKD